MINTDMVQQWTEHHHKILKYELNIHKNIHVENLGGHHGLQIYSGNMLSTWGRASSFLSRLPPQLCERDSCGGRWSLVQVSVSLQWPAGHKSVDTADTHGAIMWQFGHPVGEMLQAVQVLTKNDKIWTPSEQTLTEGIYDSRNIHEKKFNTLLWALCNILWDMNCVLESQEKYEIGSKWLKTFL